MTFFLNFLTQIEDYQELCIHLFLPLTFALKIRDNVIVMKIIECVYLAPFLKLLNILDPYYSFFSFKH